MRILVFILALINAAFFAYTWFGAGNRAGADAQIMSQQLNRDKIRLLAPQQVNALARKPEPPKPEPPKPEPPKPEPPKPKVVSACLEWGGFVGADVARAAQALEPLLSGAKLTRRTLAEPGSFWVYMPPLPSRQAATQKGGELKRLGINEFFIVTDDPKWRNAVSLGVFKTQEAAIAHLAALRTRGVRTAIVGPHDPQPEKTFFQVHEVSAALAAKLNELKQGFPNADVHDCPAPDKKG